MEKYSKTIMEGIVTHYYKQTSETILHVSHITNESDSLIFENIETGEKTTPKDKWLINTVECFGDEEITKEEFDLVIKTAISELGIYETTLAN